MILWAVLTGFCLGLAFGCAFGVAMWWHVRRDVDAAFDGAATHDDMTKLKDLLAEMRRLQ